MYQIDRKGGLCDCVYQPTLKLQSSEQAEDKTRVDNQKRLLYGKDREKMVLPIAVSVLKKLSITMREILIVTQLNAI